MQQNALMTVRVTERRAEADDICTFELRDPDGGLLPPFGAGAHIDVHVAPGLTRQYSLCNAPCERERYLIAVLRETASRGGSRGMHDDVKQGSLLRISAPRNHFPLVAARKTLLFAGGIGITPLISMAEQLSSEPSEFALHYCVRSLSRAAFHDRIAAARYRQSVSLHADDAPGTRFDAAAILAAADPDTHLYVCGPAGFVAHITGAARDAGLPAEQVHVEYFAPPALSVGPRAPDAGFEVRIASSGRRFPVGAGQSIVEALADGGVDIPVSCKEGVCGTCLTRVLDGEVEHRDYYLSETERARHDQFLPCCSRAKSAVLVLDL